MENISRTCQYIAFTLSYISTDHIAVQCNHLDGTCFIDKCISDISKSFVYLCIAFQTYRNRSQENKKGLEHKVRFEDEMGTDFLHDVETIGWKQNTSHFADDSLKCIPGMKTVVFLFYFQYKFISEGSVGALKHQYLWR